MRKIDHKTRQKENKHTILAQPRDLVQSSTSMNGGRFSEAGLIHALQPGMSLRTMKRWKVYYCGDHTCIHRYNFVPAGSISEASSKKKKTATNDGNDKSQDNIWNFFVEIAVEVTCRTMCIRIEEWEDDFSKSWVRVVVCMTLRSY